MPSPICQSCSRLAATTNASPWFLASLLLGALLVLPGCGDYSDCVIRGLRDARTDRAASMIEEMCAKKFESLLHGQDARQIVGTARISNPFKERAPLEKEWESADPHKRKDQSTEMTEQEEFEFRHRYEQEQASPNVGMGDVALDFNKYLREHVQFVVTINNDTFDWRVTGLVINIMLDKDKKVSETHAAHIHLEPGGTIELSDIEIKTLADIKKDNWSWNIIKVYGVRLTPWFPSLFPHIF